MKDKKEKKDKNWYILWSTNDCKQSKVEVIVKGLNADLWIPCFKMTYGIDKDTVPLYPGYYFIGCDEDVLEKIEDRIELLKTKKTLMFLKDENKKHYKLTKEEIQRVKKVEDEEIDKSQFAMDDTVRIKEGAMKDCEGKVIEVRKGQIRIESKMFNIEHDKIWINENNCEKI